MVFILGLLLVEHVQHFFEEQPYLERSIHAVRKMKNVQQTTKIDLTADIAVTKSVSQME